MRLSLYHIKKILKNHGIKYEQSIFDTLLEEDPNPPQLQQLVCEDGSVYREYLFFGWGKSFAAKEVCFYPSKEEMEEHYCSRVFEPRPW